MSKTKYSLSIPNLGILKIQIERSINTKRAGTGLTHLGTNDRRAKRVYVDSGRNRVTQQEDINQIIQKPDQLLEVTKENHSSKYVKVDTKKLKEQLAPKTDQMTLKSVLPTNLLQPDQFDGYTYYIKLQNESKGQPSDDQIYIYDLIFEFLSNSDQYLFVSYNPGNDYRTAVIYPKIIDEQEQYCLMMSRLHFSNQIKSMPKIYSPLNEMDEEEYSEFMELFGQIMIQFQKDRLDHSETEDKVGLQLEKNLDQIREQPNLIETPKQKSIPVGGMLERLRAFKNNKNKKTKIIKTTNKLRSSVQQGRPRSVK